MFSKAQTLTQSSKCDFQINPSLSETQSLFFIGNYVLCCSSISYSKTLPLEFKVSKYKEYPNVSGIYDTNFESW